MKSIEAKGVPGCGPFVSHSREDGAEGSGHHCRDSGGGGPLVARNGDARRHAHSGSTMKRHCLIVAFVGLAANAGANAEEERKNYFDDPFLQVTNAIATCTKQEGPKITQAEMRAESHARAERGTRCYLEGRCRLPNSYMYDKEIIPRVKNAILADGRYSDTRQYGRGQVDADRGVWLNPSGSAGDRAGRRPTVRAAPAGSCASPGWP